MVDIRAGVMVDIVFEGDETKNQIPRLQTIIYSIADRRMILPQTTPPVSKDRQGKRLLVTFLETNAGVTIRYGFWSKLKAVTNHEMTPSQPAPVLVVERETEPTKCNLRMHYRIKPMLNRGLAAFFEGVPVTIVDISVGGLRISAKTPFSFNVHDSITLTIGVDRAKFDVEGKVIRTWSPQATDSAGGRQHYASIQFISNQAARESLLSKKIILLERELLAHGVS
ncbi:MAG: PilZ domain-containing protein [Syntrophales bacterium]